MNPPHGLILLRFYGNCSYYTVPVTEDKYRQSLAGVLCSDLILFGYLLVTTAAAVSEQNVTENTDNVEQAMCVCVCTDRVSAGGCNSSADERCLAILSLVCPVIDPNTIKFLIAQGVVTVLDTNANSRNAPTF